MGKCEGQSSCGNVGYIYCREGRRGVLKEKDEPVSKEEKAKETWDAFQYLPPPHPQAPPSPLRNLGAAAGPLYPQIPDQGNQEDLAPTAPLGDKEEEWGEGQKVVSPSRTRRGTQHEAPQLSKAQEGRVLHMPLRQAPLGRRGGGVGFVTLPFTTQDIRY